VSYGSGSHDGLINGASSWNGSKRDWQSTGSVLLVDHIDEYQQVIVVVHKR